jgi:RimJ/RimL family protein N-acetyltransferase
LAEPNLFRGKLVRLAAPQPDDWELKVRWYEDSEFLRLIDSEAVRPKSADELKADSEQHTRGPAIFSFHVRTLEDDRFIGFINIHRIEWNNASGWLGMGIGDRDYWDRGYGSDALNLILNYAFNELNLYRLGLTVFEYNERAKHVYEKAGFVEEGVQRAALNRDGRRYDVTFMGLLAEEWRARQER